MSRLAQFNAQDAPAAEAQLFACCGSRRWAREMAAGRPYRDLAHACEIADKLWLSLNLAEWREAFSAHPRIGERASHGGETARRWAEQEQSAVRAVSQDVAARLAAQNFAYQEKFGYIFLVDATGKSSDEMLAILEQRIQNDPHDEIREAAEQQRRITRRRLDKLLSETP